MSAPPRQRVVTIADRAELTGLSWRQVLDLSRSDPRVFSDRLLATPAARQRLQRWVEAGRPDADPERVTFIGEDNGQVEDAVHRVLVAAPAPVRWHVVRFVTVIGLGANVAGFCAVRPPRLPRAPHGERPMLVVIAAVGCNEAELEGLAAHELAHSWLEKGARRPPKATTKTKAERRQDRRELAQFAVDHGLDRAVAALWAVHELQADALAGEVLGRFVNTYRDPQRHFSRQLAAEAAPAPKEKAP